MNATSPMGPSHAASREGDLGHMVQVEQQAQAGEAPAQDHQLRVHSTH
jgi:hypothetical protein